MSPLLRGAPRTKGHFVSPSPRQGVHLLKEDLLSPTAKSASRWASGLSPDLTPSLLLLSAKPKPLWHRRTSGPGPVTGTSSPGSGDDRAAACDWAVSSHLLLKPLVHPGPPEESLLLGVGPGLSGGGSFVPTPLGWLVVLKAPQTFFSYWYGLSSRRRGVRFGGGSQRVPGDHTLDLKEKCRRTVWLDRVGK